MSFAHFAAVLFQFGMAASAQPIENYQPMTLIESTWGQGDGQFSYKMVGGEGEYPHVFIVDDREQVYVLDDFNNRVEHFDENGRFLESIPILSFATATADQRKKLPMATRSVWIGDLRFYNGSLYAIQEIYSDVPRQGPALKILQLQGKQFVGIDASSQAKILDGVAYGLERQVARARTLLNNDPLLQVTTRAVNVPNGGKKLRQDATYGGIPVGEMVIDQNNNRWVLNKLKDGVNRKYSPNGKLLFEVKGGDVSEIVSRQGNYFVLSLFTSRPDVAQAMDLSRSKGIRITKYSLH